jgi:hypothetical protein
MAVRVFPAYGEDMETAPAQATGLRCPDCGGVLIATDRNPPREEAIRGRSTAAVASPLRLPVWRCLNCGRDRARFE